MQHQARFEAIGAALREAAAALREAGIPFLLGGSLAAWACASSGSPATPRCRRQGVCGTSGSSRSAADSPGSPKPFANRTAAGRELARRLSGYCGREDVTVLGLARGGVPIAYEVAAALRSPLDVLVVRKLGVPGHEELAFGAIASGGARVLNQDVVSAAGVGAVEIDAITRRERARLAERERRYESPRLDVEGRIAIVVDDGLATGATMRAAIVAMRDRRAHRVIAAVPVAASPTCREIGKLADAVVCAHTPEPFTAVACWYRDFPQTSDAEVCKLLARAKSNADAL